MSLETSVKHGRILGEYGQKEVRASLTSRQTADLRALEAAGARVDKMYFAGFPGDYSFNWFLAFPSSHSPDEVTLFLEERPDHRTGSHGPSSWSVLAKSSDAFIDDLKAQGRGENPLPRFIAHLKYWGFRVDDEKLLDTGETRLLVQFPGNHDKFEPDIILKADAKGLPNGWEVAR